MGAPLMRPAGLFGLYNRQLQRFLPTRAAAEALRPRVADRSLKSLVEIRGCAGAVAWAAGRLLRAIIAAGPRTPYKSLSAGADYAKTALSGL